MILEGIFGHEDVEEKCDEDTEAAREVEEELPADGVDDVTGEAEEHSAELDGQPDADTHPVELGGDEPVIDEARDEGGEEGGVEASEESEDGGD